MGDVCRSCKAPIRWARTPAGKAIPLDRDPMPDGTIALTGSHGPPLAVVIPEERRGDYEGSLYRAHFATCPDAERHRRR